VANGNTNTSGPVPATQTKIENINLTLATNSGNLSKTGYTFTHTTRIIISAAYGINSLVVFF
jgi:hypothetical protein